MTAPLDARGTGLPGRALVLDVHPEVPAAIGRLAEIATNLWYGWSRPARRLFGQLDPELWRRTGHNPKLFLRRVEQRVLDAAAEDENYLALYRDVLTEYDAYHGRALDASEFEGLVEGDLVAYLCAEYGLHESLHIYSGGLGILAGHHCKSASDLRLPLIAIGLLYRAGYFTQTIDFEGRQGALYQEADFEDLPVTPVLDSAGVPVVVGIPFPGHDVAAQVWEVRAGRVRVLLLDTDVAANSSEDRAITRQLYGGDGETRIRQEMVLGVGGVRALRALGIAPTVWHLNEGHPAFSILERVRERVAAGADFDTALEETAASTVFTTHTPVPAGHDRFGHELATRYLGPLLAGLGTDETSVLSLGRSPGDGAEFNMTTFAIRGSRYHNGVSRLHGEVSADICAGCWPQVPPSENPMEHVTNGVHVPTVLAPDWADLFDHYLGPEWRQRVSDAPYWARLHRIPDQAFWSTKLAIKARTLTAVRETVAAQLARNRTSRARIERALRLLDPTDPNVLTVGFARRFATYKRATLLFYDLDRLRSILCDPERPVVVLFAGKAHPADEPGQADLRRVHEVAQMPEFLGHVLLVEGYDLALARLLLSGVDVWLNTPIYRMEASGTSGMKAAMNGAIHFSVTDGWWEEGYEGDNGWAIEPSPYLEDPVRRDADDARTLYELLQYDAVPRYYRRGALGYPADWVSLCKRSMASVIPRFNMARVVGEYARRFYAPAARGGRRLVEDGDGPARELARWKHAVRAAWPDVSVRVVQAPDGPIRFGEEIVVEAAVRLGALRPEDVRLEIVLDRDVGLPLEPPGVVGAGEAMPVTELPPPAEPPPRGHLLEPAGTHADGDYLYRIRLPAHTCGRHLAQVRAYPHHPLLAHPFEIGLVAWAG